MNCVKPRNVREDFRRYGAVAGTRQYSSGTKAAVLKIGREAVRNVFRKKVIVGSAKSFK